MGCQAMMSPLTWEHRRAQARPRCPTWGKLEDLPRLSLARGPDVSDQQKSLGLIYSANTKTRNQAIPPRSATYLSHRKWRPEELGSGF